MHVPFFCEAVRHTGLLVLFALSAVLLSTGAAAAAAFAFVTPRAVYSSHSGFGAKPSPYQEAVTGFRSEAFVSRSSAGRDRRGFRVIGRRDRGGEGFAASAAVAVAAAAVSMDATADPKIIDGEKKGVRTVEALFVLYWVFCTTRPEIPNSTTVWMYLNYTP